MNLLGQATIIGIIMTFISLVVFAGTYPAWSSIVGNISEDAEAAGDEYTALTVRLVPFLVLVMIIVSLWVYIGGRREQAVYYPGG